MGSSLVEQMHFVTAQLLIGLLDCNYKLQSLINFDFQKKGCQTSKKALFDLIYCATMQSNFASVILDDNLVSLCSFENNASREVDGP